MQILKLENGSEWILKINVASAMYVRSRVLRRNGEPLDLLRITEVSNPGTPNAKMDLLSEITGDALLLVEIFYALLKSQLDKKNISEEQFYLSLTGDDIERATDALMKELIDFFPEAKKRVLRAIWDTTRTIQQRAEKMLDNLIDTPAMEAKIEKIVDGILSGNAPESSASIPENSPSVN